MAIVIMNDNKCYIKLTETGGVKKTQNIAEAKEFETLDNAVKVLIKAPSKTKNFYVYDTETQKTCYGKDNRKKIKRKSYSQDARRLIYKIANGRCELCGRKILFEDMTIDHIKPLSMGGEDNVENIQCTCHTCNLFKGNILPEDFMERISLIYRYQMEKECRGTIKRKILYRLIEALN